MTLGSDPELHLPITLTLDDHAGPSARVPQEHLQSMVASALLEYDRIHPVGANKPAATASAGKPAPWLVATGGAIALVGSIVAGRLLVSEKVAKPTAAPVVQEAPKPAQPEPDVQPPSAAPARTVDEDEVTTPEARTVDREDKSEKGKRAVSRGATAPEDLLQKANQLRAGGQFREAAETYSLVYDRFSKSQAAYVARVAAAALELEHLSNPLKARKLFEQALQDRPKGALDLEARQGLSVALRDLEDRAGEREALRSLVSRHPGSPAARRAQVRLMELGGE
jgi:hypothetical protein